MELADVGKLIWKRRWTVLVTLAVVVAAGVAFTLFSPKRYESTATIAFTPDSTRGASNALRPEDVSALLATYATLARSKATIGHAEANLGHRLPGALSTSTQVGTGILQLADRAATARGAADGAAAATTAFLNELKGNGLVVAQVVNPPQVNSTPVQPRPALIIPIALLLGLAAGCMLAFALDYLNQRVESADDVAELIDVPVLGHLPYKRSMSQDRGRAIVWESSELGDIQESIRALRTNLQLLNADAPRSILVTSSTAAHGKSTLVANLGIALAQASVRTLILDADMRSPRQHEIFKLQNTEGLSSLLEHWSSNGRRPEVRTQATDYDGLHVLTAGPALAASTELLYTRFRPVLAELLSEGSLVLIDSPPLLPVADARIMASEVDMTIMVVNARSERPPVLRNAVEKMRLADANVAGIVLNQTAQAEAMGYDSYYYSARA